MKMLKYVFSVVILIGIIFAQLTSKPADAAKEEGGTFRWGFAPPDSLNPFVAVNEASLILQHLNYESLVDYNSKFEYVPYLATKWEKSEDGLEWTFHLTDKSKWQDDQPLTAKDVKFTVEYIKKNKLGQFYSYVSNIKTVETPDAKTVVLTFDKPSALVLYNMRNLKILPEHIWSKLSGEEALTVPNNPVIGSGPFKFIEWKKGQYVKMEAVKNYWRGRAKIDTLILREITNDEVGVNALKAGELDGIRNVPPNLIPVLKKDPNIKVEQQKSFWFNELIINGHLKGSMGNPLLKDPKVRLAIAHAIDKKSLVDTIYNGMAQTGSTIIAPSNTKWVNSNIQQFDFNLEKAKQILQDAGYVDTDGDGIREKDGEQLKFRFNVMNETTQFRAAQQISQWLKEIGVSTNPVQTEDLGALIYRDNDKNGVVDHDFDLMLWSWSGDPDPDFNLMTMLTEQIGNWQDAGYSNKEYDELYQQQRQTLDENERKQISDKMQNIIYNDLPYVILYYPDRIQAYRSDKWDGLVPMVDGFFSKLNIQTALKVHHKSEVTNSSSLNDQKSSSDSSTKTVIWIVIGLVIVIGFIILRRRNKEVD
jgi:peptide/nickel transport system substrate-binding protein